MKYALCFSLQSNNDNNQYMITTAIAPIHSSSLYISNTLKCIHNDAVEILEKARIVSAKLGVIDPELHGGHTTMTNYLYIKAPVDRMINALVLYDILYYFDDTFGEDTLEGAMVNLEIVVAVWEGKEINYPNERPNLTNFLKALRYISNCFRADSNPMFFKKHTVEMKKHLWFATNSPSFNTVDEYLEIRLYTAGMLPAIDLMEYLNGCYISHHLLEKVPALKQVRYTCAMIGGLSNDLFSYAKEKHSDFNLVNAYLKTKEAATFEDAVIKSIALVNNLYEEYLAAVAQAYISSAILEEEDTSIISTYLDGMDVIISACYHWQKSTKRYEHPENVFVDMR
jgi:hypothetical protein